jgi:hypothetical protein
MFTTIILNCWVPCDWEKRESETNSQGLIFSWIAVASISRCLTSSPTLKIVTPTIRRLRSYPRKSILAIADKRAALTILLLPVDCDFQATGDSFIIDQSVVADQKDLSKAEFNHDKAWNNTVAGIPRSVHKRST